MGQDRCRIPSLGFSISERAMGQLSGTELASEDSNLIPDSLTQKVTDENRISRVAWRDPNRPFTFFPGQDSWVKIPG
jgi:hypothetical protein